MKTFFLFLSCLTCAAASLQEMVDASGPVLTLALGVYRGPVIIDRDIEVRGEPGVEITCDDDYESAVRVLPDCYVSISGVTFRDGFAEEGAAILSYGYLSVSNCVFTNNATIHTGGAIKAWFGAVSMVGCSFTGNSSAYGGAAYSSVFAQMDIARSTFERNETYEQSGAGGAIYIADGSLSSCIIRNNSALGISAVGGGAYFAGNVTVANTIICGNEAPTDPDYSGDYTDLGGNFIGDCSAGLAVRLVDGLPRVYVSGTKDYELQAAEAPGGPWGALTTEKAPFSYSDSSKAPARFYRIVQR